MSRVRHATSGRSATLALAVCIASAGCDRSEPEPATAPVETAEPVAEPETMDAPAPASTELRPQEQAIFGMPAPEGLEPIDVNDAFARYRLLQPLGAVRVFYRERLTNYREEHYSSAGTGFVATDGSERELFLYRRPGADVVEVTYFPTGREAADLANRGELAHTQVRRASPPVAEATARPDAEPDEPAVTRIGPNEQPALPADLHRRSPSAAPAASGISGAGRDARGGQVQVGADRDRGSVREPGGGGTVTRRGADAPNSAGPRRVGDSPLTFDNPYFERPSNPNALH